MLDVRLMCSKMKHLRHLVQDLVRGFECIEILGLSGFLKEYSSSTNLDSLFVLLNQLQFQR